MTEALGRAVVKWVNNKTGLVCLALDDGSTSLLHRSKLNAEGDYNVRKLRRGSELAIPSLEEKEWAIL